MISKMDSERKNGLMGLLTKDNTEMGSNMARALLLGQMEAITLGNL